MLLNNKRGFSLVEIMIVVAIIGLLVSTMGSRIFGGLDKAKVQNAKVMMRKFADALEMYSTDCNTYPTSDQGLDALVTEPQGEPACDNWGPVSYMKKIPKDPWGRPYIFESDGIIFNIISLGKDKREGGEGFGEDLQYKDL